MKKLNFITKYKKDIVNICLTIVAAVFSVFALHTFVVPSNFSPSGIDGLCTILYEITGINMGVFKIVINIPLLILSYIIYKFTVGRTFFYAEILYFFMIYDS